jgi:CHAT domain-containing protein/Tfp pilus assembly protein PilF
MSRYITDMCARLIMLIISLLTGVVFNQGKCLAVSHSQADSKKDSIETYNNLGVQGIREGNFENAMVNLTRSLDLINKYFPKDYEKLVYVYIRLGVINSSLWNFKDAIEKYNRAESLCNRYTRDKNSDIGLINYHKGRIFKQTGDYEKAKQHYQIALNIFESDDVMSHPTKDKYISIIYVNNSIGSLYYEMKDYKTAIEHYKKCESLANKWHNEFLPITYENLADCYTRTKKYDEAEKYYELAIKHHLQGKKQEYKYLLANVYKYYAEMCLETGQYDKAYHLLQKAYSIYTKHWGLTQPETSECLLDFGKYFEKTGKTDSALYYYQKSIICLSEGFSDMSIYANPSPDMAISPLHLINSLKHKAVALSGYYFMTRHFKDLEASLNTYELAIRLIDKIRLGYQTPESKLFLSENEKATYISAMHTAYNMWKTSADKKYLNKAFEYSERSKASVLLAAIRTSEARNFAGIPDTLLENEHNLLRDIALYKELIFEEKRKEKPEENKIRNWEQKLFTITGEYDNLIKLLEDSFPKYYSLKYNTQVATVDSLQRMLKVNHVIVEYSICDTCLFIFHIEKNTAGIIYSRIDTSFHASLNRIIHQLNNFDYTSSSIEDLRRYKDDSYNVYRYLIKPISKITDSRKLTIVPDELLALLPFEALVTERKTNGRESYRTLSYMLYKYTVSYSFSSTLYFMETKHKSIEKIKKLLAFAPGYDTTKATDEIATRAQLLRHYREGLSPIPGAKEEVAAISRIIPSDIFEDDYATERLFKDTAGFYDMLHLAMHTIINNTEPMFSKLAFTLTADTAEDGLLNTYEIYNMNLIARLAVLSSCSSGEGVLRKGEGVMSLARAFMYAGCPGIVMTLWVIEDKSGVKIMTEFYRALSRGRAKDAALRKAKIKFIEEANLTQAHPFYWSAYICVGNTDPLFIPTTLIRIIVISVLTGVAILWIIKRILRKRKKKIPQPAETSPWFKI